MAEAALNKEKGGGFFGERTFHSGIIKSMLRMTMIFIKVTKLYSRVHP
jgi:hypothetical protein